MKKAIIGVFALTLMIGGLSGCKKQDRYMATGGLVGAATGAAISGSGGGALVGAAAGAGAGYLIHKDEEKRHGRH